MSTHPQFEVTARRRRRRLARGVPRPVREGNATSRAIRVLVSVLLGGLASAHPLDQAELARDDFNLARQAISNAQAEIAPGLLARLGEEERRCDPEAARRDLIEAFTRVHALDWAGQPEATVRYRQMQRRGVEASVLVSVRRGHEQAPEQGWLETALALLRQADVPDSLSVDEAHRLFIRPLAEAQGWAQAEELLRRAARRQCTFPPAERAKLLVDAIELIDEQTGDGPEQAEFWQAWHAGLGQQLPPVAPAKAQWFGIRPEPGSARRAATDQRASGLLAPAERARFSSKRPSVPGGVYAASSAAELQQAQPMAMRLAAVPRAIALTALGGALCGSASPSSPRGPPSSL